ncbi:MAG: hypothetical protein QW701_06515 [Candidatus Nezhaarchaeales archaeon]
MEEDQKYEMFAAYGVAVEYPAGWNLDVRVLKRERGVVSFKSGVDENSFTLTWSPLKEVRKKFSSPEEHVEKVLEGFKSKSGVKELEVLEKKELIVNGHEAVLVRVRAKLKVSLFSRTWLLSNIQALYVHCDESDRCLVAYSVNPSQENMLVKTFEHVVSSIKCH